MAGGAALRRRLPLGILQARLHCHHDLHPYVYLVTSCLQEVYAFARGRLGRVVCGQKGSELYMKMWVALSGARSLVTKLAVCYVLCRSDSYLKLYLTNVEDTIIQVPAPTAQAAFGKVQRITNRVVMSTDSCTTVLGILILHLYQVDFQ